MRRALSLFTGLLAFTATTALGAYTVQRVDSGANSLVQGRFYAYQVTSTPQHFENVLINIPLSASQYRISVGAGVQVGPNEFIVDSSGRLDFSIRFHVDTPLVPLTVTNKFDSQLKTTVNVEVQKFPTTFEINPSLPTFTAGVPNAIQIRAKDALGQTVTAFQDAVQVTDRQLGDITFVPGSDFVNGVATADVAVRAGNMSNKTALTVTLAGIQYETPAAQPQATFTTPDLNLVPAPFNQIVMLFPGELLDPGFGKNGVVTTQVANVPVANVVVWPVDQFYNPIRAAQSRTISFSSSDGNDTPPADRTMNVPPLQVQGGGLDPFIFPTNGDRTIQAVPDGNGAQADTSQVPVAPGSSNLYNFTLQPGGPYTTDDLITVRIEATDTLGNRLTTLFGELDGAELIVRRNGTPTQENARWADTNPATDVPDNVVSFVQGEATINMNVTKWGSDIQLIYRDRFGQAIISNNFVVNPGALSKIHMTIRGRPGTLVGETFTPGTYPGNSGTPPEIVAGQDLVVEARLTDRRFNVVSGPSVNGTPILLDSFDGTLVGWTHPQGNDVTFDVSGELAYVSGFDRSFRVTVRTAGTERRFRATSDFSGSDFVSSSFTVVPAAYAKIAFVAPGETLVPGSLTASGKTGSPTTQAEGSFFPMTVHVTDPFWNPINGGLPNASFSISPSLPSSFISGVSLGQPVPLASSSQQFDVKLADDSDLRVADAANGAVSQTVSIPVVPLLDHFVMDFTAPGAKEAGVPFEVTVRAEDQFDGLVSGYGDTIDLRVVRASDDTPLPGTMDPGSVTLVGGQLRFNITVRVAESVKIEMSNGSVINFSDSFDVTPNSGGFQNVLLLGPDEVHAPGTAAGKTGSNTSREVGTGVTVTVLATDAYYNKLNVSGIPVAFASSDFAVFSPATGDITAGDFATTLVMHAATTHIVTATATAQGYASQSAVPGRAGAYNRIQILAPGEIADPGNVATGGKAVGATPTPQKVSVQFPVQIRAVDQFYNLTSFDGGDSVLAVNTVNSKLIPANNVIGGPIPRPFINGEISRSVLIGEQGRWIIDAKDQANLTKTGQNVEIQVNPGPTYVINSPANATAGQNFAPFTIELQEAGAPVAGYNESIFLEAYRPGGGPASGQFNADGSRREYVMTNGRATISDLQYAHVEDIQIRLTDNFNRVSFSNTIQVDPSGLKYRVVVPPTAVAGPPKTFEVRVELLEEATETLVKSSTYNHTIGVAVHSLLNPPAAGSLSLTQAPLNQGVASLTLSYSKAEEIQLEITDLNGAFSVDPAFSSSMLITPDSYKKLLIVAPGESHEPGLFQHATGKSGTPSSLDKSISHVFQVRGVDQHWNTASAFSGGQIFYSADDGSTSDEHPVNQLAPLTNGESAAAISFNTAGTITLIVEDQSDTTIVPQSVEVPVAGTFFDIQTPAQTTSGAPFSMIITLKDTTNATVPVNGPVTLVALKTDGSPATGVLDVVTANLAAGVATINNQSYTIADDVRIRVSGHDTTTISDTISFVPRAIFYIYEQVPAEASVNAPFQIKVQAYDQDTGTKVVNFNRANLPLQAFSATTGNPAAGAFAPAALNIVNGVGIVSAVYDTAESIYLVLTDNATVFDPPPLPTQNSYPSPSTIRIRAGALASVDNVATFAMQSHLTHAVTYVARDAFNNPIPDQTLQIRINSTSPDAHGQLMMNGQVDALVARTDSKGELNVTFEATSDTHGEFNLILSDGDTEGGFSQAFTADVRGLNKGPAQALGFGDLMIPVGSSWKVEDLNAMVQQAAISGGEVDSFYRIDGGDWHAYDPAHGIMANDPARGYPVFDELRTYRVEWYSSVCYPDVDPACASPVNELALSGAPNVAAVTTYAVEDKLTGYPSPFNPRAGQLLSIQFPLTTTSNVETKIYDLFGQEVWNATTLVSPEIVAGSIPHGRVFWNGANDDGTIVANGGYIVVIKVGTTGVEHKTKILVRK